MHESVVESFDPTITTNSDHGDGEEEVNDQRESSDDISILISSQVVGEDAIEMLSPTRRKLTCDLDDSDDDDAVAASNAKTTSFVSHSPPPIEPCHINKQKRDLAWVIGVHRLPFEDQVKYLWHPRMMATTTLALGNATRPINDSQRAVTSMASNKSESLLVAGDTHGAILLFDLRRHPPSIIHQANVSGANSDTKAISKVNFFTTCDLLVCNGGLHLWDIEAGKTKACSPWKNVDFVGYDTFPLMTSSCELFYSGNGEVAAISSSRLYMIDMRCSGFSDQQQIRLPKTSAPADPMVKHLPWHLSKTTVPTHTTSKHHHLCVREQKASAQAPSFNLKCNATHGDWVCVGSSSGHIHCFDRRTSKLLVCWKAHTKSIEYLQAVSRQLLLSVSADKTAVVWNLAHTPPQQISSIYSEYSIYHLRCLMYL
jgi:WD40 repeat protein